MVPFPTRERMRSDPRCIFDKRARNCESKPRTFHAIAHRGAGLCKRTADRGQCGRCDTGAGILHEDVDAALSGSHAHADLPPEGVNFKALLSNDAMIF